MADCCHPIPGDDVLGYIDEQNRVVIHKRQCPVATRLKSSYGNRIIATEWDTHKDLSFLVTIYIKGIDSMGLLNEVTQVISRQLNVNIRKLTSKPTMASSKERYSSMYTMWTTCALSAII